MRAVLAPEPGGIDALQLLDLPQPEPAAGEVLIEIAAAGLNRADLLQRQGFYPPPPGASDVLGLECSGTIAALGADVTGFRVGDSVCALLSGGGYADFTSVPAVQVAHLPISMDVVAAGGLMETACTVWSNLAMVAGLTAGETVLIHGGTSGIGTMAIQVAKALGAQVVCTVGSAAKAEAATGLGADVVINYKEQEFTHTLRDAGIAADVILDIIGAKYLEANVNALAVGGRLVIIGLQGGIQANLNLATLLMKRASITATSLRARPSSEKAAIVSATVQNVFPMIESGAVRLTIDSTYDITDVAAAHAALEESAHVGKLLLTL